MLIQRYLAKQLLGPVLGVFSFSVAVVAIFYMAQLLAWAAQESWPVDAVLGMAGLRLVLYFDVLIPVSVLLGLVIGLGRVQQAQELTALASAGVGQGGVFRLMGIWVLALCVLVALFSMVLRPWGYGQFYDIETAMAERLDITRIEPGRFQVGDDEWLIYAKTKQGSKLNDVFVHQLRPTGRGVLTATQMTQQLDDTGLIRLMFEGNVASYTLPTPGPNQSSQLVSRFDRLEVLVEPQPVNARDKIRRALAMDELWGTSRPIEVAELQWRLVTPLSVLLMAWAAAGLVTQRPRAPRAVFVVSALIVATLYFSALGVLVNWVEQSRLGALPGVFLAPLLLAFVLLVHAGFAKRPWRRWR
ncbi:MAG TPA: LptF/LptG family permease [Wenzhouxiangella sp.]